MNYNGNHLDQFAEAKISKLGISSGWSEASEQHVLQLQVSVHHHGSQAVQVLQRCSNLFQPPEGVQPCVHSQDWAGVPGEHLMQDMHLQTEKYGVETNSHVKCCSAVATCPSQGLLTRQGHAKQSNNTMQQKHFGSAAVFWSQ